MLLSKWLCRYGGEEMVMVFVVGVVAGDGVAVVVVAVAVVHFSDNDGG